MYACLTSFKANSLGLKTYFQWSKQASYQTYKKSVGTFPRTALKAKRIKNRKGKKKEEKGAVAGS